MNQEDNLSCINSPPSTLPNTIPPTSCGTTIVNDDNDESKHKMLTMNDAGVTSNSISDLAVQYDTSNNHTDITSQSKQNIDHENDDNDANTNETATENDDTDSTDTFHQNCRTKADLILARGLLLANSSIAENSILDTLSLSFPNEHPHHESDENSIQESYGIYSSNVDNPSFEHNSYLLSNNDDDNNNNNNNKNKNDDNQGSFHTYTRLDVSSCLDPSASKMPMTNSIDDETIYQGTFSFDMNDELRWDRSLPCLRRQRNHDQVQFSPSNDCKFVGTGSKRERNVSCDDCTSSCYEDFLARSPSQFCPPSSPASRRSSPYSGEADAQRQHSSVDRYEQITEYQQGHDQHEDCTTSWNDVQRQLKHSNTSQLLALGLPELDLDSQRMDESRKCQQRTQPEYSTDAPSYLKNCRQDDRDDTNEKDEDDSPSYEYNGSCTSNELDEESTREDESYRNDGDNTRPPISSDSLLSHIKFRSPYPSSTIPLLLYDTKSNSNCSPYQYCNHPGYFPHNQPQQPQPYLINTNSILPCTSFNSFAPLDESSAFDDESIVECNSGSNHQNHSHLVNPNNNNNNNNSGQRPDHRRNRWNTSLLADEGTTISYYGTYSTDSGVSNGHNATLSRQVSDLTLTCWGYNPVAYTGGTTTTTPSSQTTTPPTGTTSRKRVQQI